MQVSGKTFGRTPSEMPSNVGLREKEQEESWENLFKQALGKESFFSFTRTAENPIQWIHLLDPFHQQNVCNGSKGLNVDCGDEKGSGSESSHDAASCFKDHSNSRMKGNGVFGRGVQESGKEMAPMRLPEAMVALAQAAAKGNGLSGWSFMSPFKVQMQKCEKCSIEFFSPLNYRRHIRLMHRRSLNSEKDDFCKEKGQLAIFWDKLTPEAASSIVASKSLILEDLTGESIVKALTTLLQQPGLSSLPHSYMKAGASLLKFVQNKCSRLASQDLLDLLDESSEKTFVSLASSSSDRYTFEGGARKFGLECKNLVASLGYLVERNLVKAWMEDKDAEAWRCQRALVEEEEASQKMLAEIQERKRLKKVRQKELKDKERKSLDPTVGPQSLDVDPMDGENLQSNQQGEDSSCVLQSSHSLSTFSGQCVNGDSCKTDGNEFESYTGRYDNLYDRLADEGREVENEQDSTSNGSSEFSKEKEISEGNLQTVLNTGGSQGFGPEESAKKVVETGCSKEAGFTDRNDFPNRFSKETRKSSMDSKMYAHGKIVPSQNFKESWEDGKHFESKLVRSYPKSLSVTELGLDGSNKEEQHRALRNLSGMEGQSWQDFPRSRTNQKASGYSYQGKLQGNRLFTHCRGAVWTRKVHENSNARIGELSEDVECTGVSPDLTQGPLPENQKHEGSCISAQEDTSDASSCGSAQESSDCENSFFKIGMPCDSSGQVQLSASGSGQLFELSDKVEAKEKLYKDCSLTDISSLEDLEGQVVPHDAVQKFECSIHQRCCECQSTNDVSDHSLVIGSLNVPLGKSSADFCDAAYTTRSQEMTKMSQQMNHAHDINHVREAVYDGEGKGSERLHQESLGALQENGISPSGFRKEFLRLPARLDPECKENHEQINPEAMGLERPTKRAPLSSANVKVGSAKVWRPVSLVGRNCPEIAVNESKFGVPHRNDLDDSPSIGRDGQDNVMAANILDHEIDSSDSEGKITEICEMKTWIESKQGGDEVPSDEAEICEMKTWIESNQGGDEGPSDEASHEDEGLPLRHTLSIEMDVDNVENHASKEEGGSLTGVELNNGPSFLSSKLVASFLSQRWIDAVTTPESLMSSMLKERGQYPETMTDRLGEINTDDSLADQSLGFPYLSNQCHAGNVHIVSSNDAKSSSVELSKQRELSTLAVTGNFRVRAKDRWHQKSKFGRSELRYIPK